MPNVQLHTADRSVRTAGVYDENKSYTFKYPRPKRPRALRVYECHVGMSTEEEKVNSYLEFRDEMVPRIRSLGYNTIQIMAIQVRHPMHGYSEIFLCCSNLVRVCTRVAPE